MNHELACAPGVGRAYDFRRIASAPGCDLWVCFAHSDSNRKILRLAPACERPQTADSVCIKTTNNVTRWLIPGVEIAIHSMDLEDAATGERFALAAEEDDAERPADTEATGDDDAARERLSEIGLRIEAHFHEPSQPVIPSVEECRLDAIEPGEPTARFSWKPDLRRTYRLTREGTLWRLFQRYDDAASLPTDTAVPFRTRDSVYSFSLSADGIATATIDNSSDLLKALGLEYVAYKNELRREALAIVIPIAKAIRGRPFSAGAFKRPSADHADPEPTHAVSLLLSANDPQFRIAASFATEEAASPTAQRTVQFDWNGDVVQLIARPDPTGERVRLVVRIDAPKWTRSDARLELQFPGVQVDPTGIVLTEVTGRLQGVVSIGIPWAVFTAQDETPVEVLGAPALAT